ncbi:MAG: hypothetical protein ACRD15_20845 [Vicinamibacterales bacterium]
MAKDRNRTDEEYIGPDRGRQRDTDMNDEWVRGGAGEDVRGIVDEGDAEIDDADEMDEEDVDESY